jgi:hypothetical protein
MDFAPSHKKTPGQIKVTIVKVPVPGNREKCSAHNAVYGARVETGIEFFHVFVEVT